MSWRRGAITSISVRTRRWVLHVEVVQCRPDEWMGDGVDGLLWPSTAPSGAWYALVKIDNECGRA